jgi:hypothetical protein
LTVSSKNSTSGKTNGSRPSALSVSKNSWMPRQKIRMDVESVKDRQPFALTLAAFLDLAPFFIDRIDFVANELGG